jgi:hypothetical protein
LHTAYNAQKAPATGISPAAGAFFRLCALRLTRPSYLADIDRQAEELFLRLVKQMAAAEGISETLKASNPMEWVGRIKSCRNRATEIVCHQVIYT